MHKLPITFAVRAEAKAYSENMLPDPVTGVVKYPFLDDVQGLLNQLKNGKGHMRKQVGKKKKDMTKSRTETIS